MDIATIITMGLVPLSGVVSWFAAKRTRNNSTLQAMQESINMLVSKNSELIEEIVELRAENAELKDAISQLKQTINNNNGKD